MQQIDSSAELKTAILQLENNQAENAELLKTQFHLAYESVKPINLLKSTLQEVAGSKEVEHIILNTSVGLAAGYLSKVLFEGVSHSPYKKVLGAVVMFGITNLVAQNPETVKALGRGLFNLIRSKRAKMAQINYEL